MPPRSSAGLPAPPPHPISPPMRGDPSLSRPLPVSWAPPHPGPPGPAVLRRSQGRRRPSSPGPPGTVGPARLPRPARPRTPASFGACRAAAGSMLAPSGVRAARGRSANRRREHDPAAGPGLGSTRLRARKGRGFGSGEGWGQKLRTRGRRGTRGRGGAWSRAVRGGGASAQVPSARIRGWFGAGPQASDLFGGGRGKFGCGRGQELRPDGGHSLGSLPEVVR